jgi:hypothetical protein
LGSAEGCVADAAVDAARFAGCVTNLDLLLVAGIVDASAECPVVRFEVWVPAKSIVCSRTWLKLGTVWKWPGYDCAPPKFGGTVSSLPALLVGIISATAGELLESDPDVAAKLGIDESDPDVAAKLGIDLTDFEHTTLCLFSASSGLILPEPFSTAGIT